MRQEQLPGRLQEAPALGPPSWPWASPQDRREGAVKRLTCWLSSMPEDTSLMSEAVLIQDHMASSPLRFSQLEKLEGGKKCWQSALKLLSYPCSFCSSAPKSERVMWFILKTETSLDPQVSRAKTISSHHSCLAWEQNAAPVGVSAGDWRQEDWGRGRGKKGIFHVYSGQMMEKSLVCVCLALGRANLSLRKGGTGSVSLGKQSWDVPLSRFLLTVSASFC